MAPRAFDADLNSESSAGLGAGADLRREPGAALGQEAVIRERRLGSLLAYAGSSGELARLGDLNPPGCCRDNTFNQCGDCSSQRAMLPISQIRDSAMVNHAPLGCSADFPEFNQSHRRGLKVTGRPPEDIRAISTNLLEKDLVMGGGAKLAAAVDEAYRRFSPKAIFVTASCASGVIGDDIEEVTRSAERRLGIPVVPIYCEGFKSMVWTTGFDAGYHGIARKLVRPPRRRRDDVINVFNFSNIRAFDAVLAKMGLTPRYLVHQASVDELAEISEAAASAHICETLGTYMAASLERLYGVPEVRCPPPYGIEWTDRWVRELGKITGREELAEKAIASEKERVMPELERLRSGLRGLRVYAFGGAAFCHNMLAAARDLDLEIAGMTGFHHDMTYDNGAEEIKSIKNIHGLTGGIGKVTVCNKQPYQLVKILREIRPDVILSRHGNLPVQAVKLGIPTFFAGDANMAGGYDGVVALGKKTLLALSGRNFVRNIAAHARFPYTGWWMRGKDPFLFRRAV
ncbi:MAG: nitrogenase [Deltaproteobacteria bacterium]|jgi:nitrogenase molybdenum-iron protein alpha chain|nr:nitrogenase [Deltaproteobacteria bacterium]